MEFQAKVESAEQFRILYESNELRVETLHGAAISKVNSWISVTDGQHRLVNLCVDEGAKYETRSASLPAVGVLQELFPNLQVRAFDPN